MLDSGQIACRNQMLGRCASANASRRGVCFDDSQGAGEASMNDRELRQNILHELEFEPSVAAENIGVAVENGVVTLTGHVRSFAEKAVAERVVNRVKGVRAIAQEIAVRLPSNVSRADDQIA